MDEELREKLDALETMVSDMHQTLEEYLPLIRAYLDPEQSGPRGYFMRRQLARSNGHG